MSDPERVESARKVFAGVTGAREDASLLAADAQAAADLVVARDSCERLLARLRSCIVRLDELRRRLG